MREVGRRIATARKGYEDFIWVSENELEARSEESPHTVMNITATSYVTDETQHESKPNADINSCHPDLQFFHDPWRRERKKEKRGINSDRDISTSYQQS